MIVDVTGMSHGKPHLVPAKAVWPSSLGVLEFRVERKQMMAHRPGAEHVPLSQIGLSPVLHLFAQQRKRCDHCRDGSVIKVPQWPDSRASGGVKGVDAS